MDDVAQLTYNDECNVLDREEDMEQQAGQSDEVGPIVDQKDIDTAASFSLSTLYELSPLLPSIFNPE